jgi:hypothetical protein
MPDDASDRCPICRYRLEGLPADRRCPECGVWERSAQVILSRPGLGGFLLSLGNFLLVVGLLLVGYLTGDFSWNKLAGGPIVLAGACFSLYATRMRTSVAVLNSRELVLFDPPFKMRRYPLAEISAARYDPFWQGLRLVVAGRRRWISPTWLRDWRLTELLGQALRERIEARR